MRQGLFRFLKRFPLNEDPMTPITAQIPQRICGAMLS